MLILGPNGAGKSTAMKAMLGLLEFKIWNMLQLMEKIYQTYLLKIELTKGISFVPQTRNVFTGANCSEKILEMGAFLRNDNLEKIIE